jgi:hypothetical protein
MRPFERRRAVAQNALRLSSIDDAGLLQLQRLCLIIRLIVPGNDDYASI